MMPFAALRLRNQSGLPPSSGTGWDPASALSGKYTFSNSNRTATLTSLITAGSVLGAVSNSSGKKHFEVVYSSTLINDADKWCGVAAAGTPVTGRPGADFTGGSFASLRFNTQSGTDAGFSGSGAGQPGAGTNTVIECDVDFSASTVALYKVGGSLLATLTFTSGSAMFPFVTREDNGAGNNFILRTKAGEFTGTLRSGFSAWEP